ncbi:MAG: trigger factor [Nitrospinae bacterium]|nr:trigger factor [Nitrospinota bacterium]
MSGLKIEMADVQPWVKRIKVEVPVEKVSEEKSAVIAEYTKEAQVQGYRKGRAPRKIIEKMYANAIKGETGQRVIEKAYKEAIEGAKLSIIGEPMFEDIRTEEGSAFSFAVTVELLPQVEPKDISAITLVKKIKKVTDEDVNTVIDRYREQNARMEPVDGRGVQEGDYAIIDYSAEKDGTLVSHFNGANRQVFVTQKSMMEGFYNGILGMKKGENKQYEAALPKDFPDPELAGAQVTFKVAVNEIKRKILPEADDQFAKEVSEFDTISELKADMRAMIEKRNGGTAESVLREDLLTRLIEDNPFEIPPRLMDRSAKSMIKNAERNMENQGFSKEEIEETRAERNETKLKQAERAIKEEVILDSLGRADGVRVENEDLEMELAKIARGMNQTVEETKRQIANSDGMNGLLNHAYMEKVYAHIMGKVKINEEWVD